MKLVHTAGWLLGIELPHLFGQATQLRQARLDTVDRILVLAAHEQADAVVVAGNVFVDNRIDLATIEALSQRLSRSRVPVFLLPGIFDPYLPDSPYLRFPERFGAPVQVLVEPTPLGDGTLLPLPVRSREPEYSWDFPAGEGLRVGVACAANEDLPDEFELDYMALGYEPGPEARAPNAWYSGAPEPNDFGHRAGQVLVVQIAAGRPPIVTPKTVAGHQWVDLQSHELATLDERLLGIARPLETLVRVTLTGEMPAAQFKQIEDFEQRQSARFLHFELDNQVNPQGAFSTPLLKAIAAKVAQAEPELARLAMRRLAELARP